MRYFSSPGSPPTAMDSRWDTPKGVGCPIRISRDHRALAPPPSFSQRATSFIASRCQGIHQMPFSCSPTPSPKAARRAAGGQMSEIRCQIAPGRPGPRAAASITPDRCPEACVRIAPTRVSPGVSAYPCPGTTDRPAKAQGPGRSILSCPLHGHDSLHDVKASRGPHHPLAGRRAPISPVRAAAGGRLPSSWLATHAWWWAWADLNGRPHAYQACALTS